LLIELLIELLLGPDMELDTARREHVGRARAQQQVTDRSRQLRGTQLQQ
jgi:hypothetical protein